MVIKVDVAPGREKRVGQLPIQPVKARMQRGEPAVCVVEGVETYLTATKEEEGTHQVY